MKVKTSVTLSADLLEQLDRLLSRGGSSRSAVLEQALREYLANRNRRERDARDLRILDSEADALNKEALDVLEYQVET
jgi:metal-responsive CopG/Arc/MetJ family transcriptional regulator